MLFYDLLIIGKLPFKWTNFVLVIFLRYISTFLQFCALNRPLISLFRLFIYHWKDQNKDFKYVFIFISRVSNFEIIAFKVSS